MDRVYVMQLARSHQNGLITRREFATRASLAIGGVAGLNSLLTACAPTATSRPPVLLSPTSGPGVNPAEAATPETKAEPRRGEVVGYSARSGDELSGYLVLPQDGAKGPPVVVVQEWWGLNDHIKDVAERFAEAGYVALAPDLYHGAVVSEPDEARKLVMELDMAAAVAEIGAAADYLVSHEATDGSQAAVVGFCMGGRLALQTALVEDQLATVIPFYGTPLAAEQAPAVKSPVLGFYGENDTGIPVDDVRSMESALAAANVESEIHIYPGAGHAFFNDTRESYHPEAAADAWERMMTWLRNHQSA